MKHVLLSSLVIFLFLTGYATAQSDVPAKAKSRASSPNSSLDALVRRIDGYWNALLAKEKNRAAKYISAADRGTFLNSTVAQFSNPFLKSLELSKDRKQAMVTLVVQRELQPFNRTMEWPVKEHWRFERGNWYRSFSDSNSFLVFPDKVGGKAPKEQPERLNNEIKEALRIEKTVLDFGTVRESPPVQLNLKYTLSGKEPLSAVFRMPAGFGIQGGDEQVLHPGEQELRITVPVWQFDGEVHERMILTVRRQGVEVPFEIEMKGYVYVPISITPKILSFQREENEKEVRVRNNSKSELELLPIFTETGQVVMESLPRTVLPGQEVVLRVKLAKQAAKLQSNKRDMVAIPFAKPVDGVNSLSLTVVMNVVNKIQNAGKPAAKEEVLLPADKSRNCQSPPETK